MKWVFYVVKNNFIQQNYYIMVWDACQHLFYQILLLKDI